MAALATIIPPEVWNCYNVAPDGIQQLDSSGEDCTVCDRDSAYIEVQWYGKDADGNDLYGECCADCLLSELDAKDVDPEVPVTVEYER